MVHMLVRHEGMQRSVNRTGAWIQIEDAMTVHRIHPVFDGRLWTTVRTTQVASLHRAHLVEIERREAVAFRGTQIAS